MDKLVVNHDLSKMERTKQLNIVIVGDGYIGKTCLLHTYVNGGFTDTYLPSVCDIETTDLELGGKKYILTIHDTAGQEDFDHLRKLQYSGADAFILCYSCTEKNSFDNIKAKWAPELKRECPYVPIVLVATKIDLRAKFPAKATSIAAGEAMRNDIRAVKFLECSSKDYKNVNEVFEEAIRATELPQKDGKESGSIFDCFSRCFK